MTNPKFTEDEVNQVSKAAATILNWILSSEKFFQVKKVVAPKEKKLKEAEIELSKVEAELAKKEKALKEVQDMVADLQRNLDTSLREAQTLES